MISPTYGKISMAEVQSLIHNYISKYPNSKYKITVGSDSQNHDNTKMVLVMAIWRVGSGGIYFYETKTIKKITNLTEKIYYETNLSLKFSEQIVKMLKDMNLEYDVEIHVDIGRTGDTCKLIPEIVGWVTGCGYNCKIKPESYTASGIANKLSK